MGRFIYTASCVTLSHKIKDLVEESLPLPMMIFILRPIMKASAKNNKKPAFTQQNSMQLKRILHNNFLFGVDCCWLTKLKSIFFQNISICHLDVILTHASPLCCHSNRFRPSWVTEKYQNTGSCLNTHVCWVSLAVRRPRARNHPQLFPLQGKSLYQITLKLGKSPTAGTD